MSKKTASSSKKMEGQKEKVIRQETSAEERSHRETDAPAGDARKEEASGEEKREVSSPSGEGEPVRLNREELLKRQLIQHREKIVKEAKDVIVRYIKGDARQLVDTALDDGDWSVIDFSEDINLRRLETHRGSLLKIEESLRKIKEGTYGICEDCSEEISAARLRVMPFAIYCKDCQEKREELEKIEREES
jgi:DnaK suppressor protein